MNNDIFFLANKEYNKIKKNNDNNDIIKEFICNKKEYIKGKFINSINNNVFDNELVEKEYYKYIFEIYKFDINNISNEETNNNIDKETFLVLNNAFIQLKTNKQKPILESFKNVNINQINKTEEAKKIKIIIKNDEKPPENNEEISENNEDITSNNKKTLDLRNKI